MSNIDKESQEKLTPDEIQANEVQAMYNAYDLSTPVEQAKMRTSMHGDHADYVPSADLTAAGYAVSSVEEFQSRKDAVRSVRRLWDAARKPDGQGPRNALSVWAQMGKVLRIKP